MARPWRLTPPAVEPNFFNCCARPSSRLFSKGTKASRFSEVELDAEPFMMAPVFFDDPHFNFIPYNPWLAYGQSKTANVLMAVEATRRWANAGIFANALNPGAIPTNLQKARWRQTRHAT